jgi:uncharacterized protein YuzE
MKKKMRVYYDKEGDFLELMFGPPRKGIFRPLGDECFERVDKNNKIIGYAIFNFTKRFRKTPEMTLPIRIE